MCCRRIPRLPTIRKLLLIFLRQVVYQKSMNRKAGRERPDIVAATRGGDNSLGMEGEADLATATLEQALYWRNIYAEILAMEESVLERIQELMAGQSRQARQEVALTNVPVVVAQAERFRSRLGFWETACRRIDARAGAHAPILPARHAPEPAAVAAIVTSRDED